MRKLYARHQDTKRDPVVTEIDLRPPEKFETFLRVDIQSGDIIKKRPGVTSEDIDKYKFSK